MSKKMHFHSLYIFTLLLISQISLSLSSNAQSQTPGTLPALVAVVIDAPTIILPSSLRPLEQRNAKILPEEYLLAQELRPLLAAAKYAEAKAVLEATEIPKLSPPLMMVRGQIAMQQKRYTEALRHFADILSEQPDFIRAHQAIAITHLLTGDEDKALASLTHAVELGASDIQVYAQLAYLHLKRENFWGAISAYQYALMLDADNKSLKSGLLHALLQSGNDTAAAKLLDQLLREDPARPALWLQRTELALRLKDTHSAIAALEAATRLGNAHSANLLLLAQLHLQEHSFDRATKILSNKNLAKQLSPNALSQAVNWLVSNKEWGNAKSLLSSIQAYLPSMSGTDQSQYYHSKGKLALAQNQLTNAASTLKTAVSKDPSNASALLDYAEVSVRLKRYTRAEILYERCKALPSIRREALIGQAQLYIDWRNYPKALAVLKTARQEFPAMANLAENIYSLGQIIAASERS